MRFRLKTLLLAVVAAAIACAYFAPLWHDRALQESRRETLAGIRGQVLVVKWRGNSTQIERLKLDYLVAGRFSGQQLAPILSGLNGLSIELLDVGHADINDADAMALANVRGLKSLELFASSITDSAFKEMASIDGLNELKFDFTPIDDAGVAHLSSSKSLTKLSLGHSKITDSGLQSLATMKQLKYLFFDSAAVTDKGMEAISASPSLEELIVYARISDAGMESLAKLKSLRRVSVGGSVTDEGVAKLRQALPGCDVDHIKLEALELVPIYGE